jgi:MFS family permease
MIYFLAAVAAIAGLLFGYDEGVIAVASPSLQHTFPMSPLEDGFTTAAVPLGALVGAILAGKLTQALGRRRVLMMAAALFAVGAVVAAIVGAVWMLMVARLVLGLAIGVAVARWFPPISSPSPPASSCPTSRDCCSEARTPGA